MSLLFWALGILFVGGLISGGLHRSALANAAGAGSAVIGCGLGAIAAVATLANRMPSETIRLPWSVPGGEFVVALDTLSAWFALVAFLVCGLAAIFGSASLRPLLTRKSAGSVWLQFNVLTVAIVVILIARDAILFLMAWEVMALASYFLVVLEDEKPRVREAGRIYLIASHLGTAFLLAMFAYWGARAGSFEFDVMAAWARESGAAASGVISVLFLFALVGFGTKAGFVPLHSWLPETYPVAPSFVAAVLTGVMSKTGIYGLMRLLTMFDAPPTWWAWLLIAIGVMSGILGVLYAVAEQDLKRLLSYSSIENLGIIALGMGVGLLGRSLEVPSAAVLGFSGALLHVLNHALFKSLLFFGAGSIAQATGTTLLDRLGGLTKRAPVLALLFGVGSLAICGLPPLNGFMSEFLIYLGALQEETLTGAAGGIPALVIIGSLAWIGGLALVAFTKAFAITFLGSPRTPTAAHAVAPTWLEQLPMAVLAIGCCAAGLFVTPLLKTTAPIVGLLSAQGPETVATQMMATATPLFYVVLIVVVMIVIALGLVVLRRFLLARQTVASDATWGCGYARPTARMQYTSSSFAEPVTGFFKPLLQERVELERPTGLFPESGFLATRVQDPALARLYRPLFSLIDWGLSKLSWIQHGHLHLYILYIGVTLIALLIWYFRTLV